MSFSIESVLEAMVSVVPASAPLHVDQFETTLASTTGAGYAIATVNGTAALHTCLLLSGVNAGDEVIIPALSFVATANAVSYCGAVAHFADSDESTLGFNGPSQC